MIRNCLSCNQKISRSKSQFGDSAFCNQYCYSKFKAKKFLGKGNPRYNGGERKLSYTTCGTSFTRKSCGKNNKERNFCSPSCYYSFRSTYYVKERHPLFKGVIGRTTKLIRSTKKYYIWRQSVLSKNDYSCHITL